MEKMTLARALRYKKRVVETIRNLESDVQTNNSVVAGSERETDVRTALKQRDAWVKHLVDLKLAIQEATRPIQRLVLEMAETKSEIAFWNRVDTTNGPQKDRWGGTNTEIKMEAALRKSDKDECLKKLQERIDSLQTRIDDHNASTQVNVASPQLP
jgi:cell fate (sporulation/competence/biofilm development) regulator YmcA (YheA/YmcA/DUF963 family)